jgi:hypothetical protein
VFTSRKGTAMRAVIGDRLIVKGHHQGEHERDAEVVEVLGEDGGPPFRVRWSDDGHVSLLFPGSDVSIEHFTHHEARRREATHHSSG